MSEIHTLKKQGPFAENVETLGKTLARGGFALIGAAFVFPAGSHNVAHAVMAATGAGTIYAMHCGFLGQMAINTVKTVFDLSPPEPQPARSEAEEVATLMLASPDPALQRKVIRTGTAAALVGAAVGIGLGLKYPESINELFNKPAPQPSGQVIAAPGLK